MQEPVFEELQIKQPQNYFTHAAAAVKREVAAAAAPVATPAADAFAPAPAAARVAAAFEAWLEAGLDGAAAAAPMDGPRAMAAEDEVAKGAQGEGTLDDDGRRRNPAAGAVPKSCACCVSHKQAQIPRQIRMLTCPLDARGRRAALLAEILAGAVPIVTAAHPTNKHRSPNK